MINSWKKTVFTHGWFPYRRFKRKNEKKRTVSRGLPEGEFFFSFFLKMILISRFVSFYMKKMQIGTIKSSYVNNSNNLLT